MHLIICSTTFYFVVVLYTVSLGYVLNERYFYIFMDCPLCFYDYGYIRLGGTSPKVYSVTLCKSVKVISRSFICQCIAFRFFNKGDISTKLTITRLQGNVDRVDLTYVRMCNIWSR